MFVDSLADVVSAIVVVVPLMIGFVDELAATVMGSRAAMGASTDQGTSTGSVKQAEAKLVSTGTSLTPPPKLPAYYGAGAHAPQQAGAKLRVQSPLSIDPLRCAATC